MLSSIPFDKEKMENEDLDREIARIAMIAEFDAINLYEQLAAVTEDDKLKDVLLDVANEEKAHVGEFQAILLRLDLQQGERMEEGEREVEEMDD